MTTQNRVNVFTPCGSHHPIPTTLREASLQEDIPHLREETKNALLWMHLCMWEDRTHPKVKTGTTKPSSTYRTSFRFTTTTAPYLGPIKLLEQNPETGSLFAKAAKEGAKISWLFRMDGKYLGPVVCQLPGDSHPVVYTSGRDLRQTLEDYLLHE